jgi:hypothetical protein
MKMTIDEQVELINNRMFRNRIKQVYREADMPYKGWHEEDSNRSAREKIKKYLELGYRVTAGYYTTRIRDYHRHVVLHKRGVVPKIKRSDYTKEEEQ